MHTNDIFMHTQYIYTDASICLARNHQELSKLSTSCSGRLLNSRAHKAKAPPQPPRT